MKSEEVRLCEQVRSRGGSISMEEGWRVHLSSSEATASDYEEVSQNVGIQRQFRSLVMFYLKSWSLFVCWNLNPKFQ